AGQEIMGQKVYGSLDELPVKADMVDIFRNSEAAGPITDDAIKHGAKVVWMQLGVRNDEAAKRAERAGLQVVMNRCPKIEHSRLTGSIEWHGIASGVISSKRRALSSPVSTSSMSVAGAPTAISTLSSPSSAIESRRASVVPATVACPSPMKA